ncbi:unnamed protein product [marine sediment metagenome]|uniref:Uncharacterized protein n=1 Tax=marine sediment metagenome TaxID=412755 RepID=X1BVA6_9ZZZZ
MEIKYKKIQINEKIEFISFTKKYGRVAFQFCPTFNKKGRLMKIYITPIQQPDKTYQGWYIEIDNSDLHQQVIIEDHPLYTMEFGRPIFSYCKNHKTVCINVKSPLEAKYLYCDHIGSDIWFKFSN